VSSLDFPILGAFLPWKVGDGLEVRVGKDAIMGCNLDIFLREVIFLHLQDLGNFNLNEIANGKVASL